MALVKELGEEWPAALLRRWPEGGSWNQGLSYPNKSFLWHAVGNTPDWPSSQGFVALSFLFSDSS